MNNYSNDTSWENWSNLTNKIENLVDCDFLEDNLLKNQTRKIFNNFKNSSKDFLRLRNFFWFEYTHETDGLFSSYIEKFHAECSLIIIKNKFLLPTKNLKSTISDLRTNFFNSFYKENSRFSPLADELSNIDNEFQSLMAWEGFFPETIYPFETPLLFRAQTTKEGIKYGQTEDFLIVGAIVESISLE